MGAVRISFWKLLNHAIESVVDESCSKLMMREVYEGEFCIS